MKAYWIDTDSGRIDGDRVWACGRARQDAVDIFATALLDPGITLVEVLDYVRAEYGDMYSVDMLALVEREITRLADEED